MKIDRFTLAALVLILYAADLTALQTGFQMALLHVKADSGGGGVGVFYSRNN